MKQTINIGNIGTRSTTARGSRYPTQQDFDRQVSAGLLTVKEEERDKEGNLKKVPLLMLLGSSKMVIFSVLAIFGEKCWNNRLCFKCLL